MPRKAKKRVHPMPKLGWKDLLLYWTAMLLLGGGAVISMFYPTYYRDRVAERNPDMISYAAGEGSLQFFWLTIWLLTALLLIIPFYQKRFPIFGRKDIKYGPPAYPRTYPLLMKEKPQYWQSPRKAAMKRKLTVIVLVVLAVTLVFSAAVYPRSLYGRYELLRSAAVVVYDSHNQESEYYSIGDIRQVCLDTAATSSGRGSSGKWYARMTLHFADGDACSFSVRGFGDDWTEALRIAQMLKERYGRLVVIEDTENLQKVVRDWKLTPQEEQLLYQLYELKK